MSSMYSARNRNKLCLSLDNSSSTASSNTLHLNRWSEVVPPKTALTFAALWDPREGMVTFSGAALLETDGPSETSPHLDVLDDDDLSQFISVDRDAGAGGGTMTTENTATLATFQEAFKAFLHRTPSSWDSRERLNAKLSGSGQVTPRCLHTRASSTFDGLDIYSHDVQLKTKRSLQLSRIDLLDVESSLRAPSAFGKLRLRSDLKLDTHLSEPTESDSVCGNRPSWLKSRFSTTTTASSNCMDVTTSSLKNSRISDSPSSAVQKWTSPEDDAKDQDAPDSWPFLLPRRPRRLLRKRRPLLGGSSDGTATAILAATTSKRSSLPCPPRKASVLTRKSSSSASPYSLSSSTTAFSASSTLGEEREQRGRLLRKTSMMLTKSKPTGPIITPSSSKGPLIKLRFTFSLRRKSRQPSPDTDGWVCIDVTPVIRQRYIANLDDEDE